MTDQGELPPYKINQRENVHVVAEGTRAHVEGLGEVEHGAIIPIPRHQKIFADGTPLVTANGDPVWCESVDGLVSVVHPKEGNSFVTVVCQRNRVPDSVGQCNVKFRYPIKK